MKRLVRAWQALMTRLEAFKNDAPSNALLEGLMGKQAEHLMRDVWFSDAGATSLEPRSVAVPTAQESVPPHRQHPGSLPLERQC